MYLKKGDYTHPIGEPQIAISKLPVLDGRGIPVAHTVTWNIQGQLQGSGQSDMDAKIEAFLEAYSRQNEDIVFLLSDGVTESQHTLKVRDTVGGVFVTNGPNFPDGSGAEYATKRTFDVQVSAEVPVDGAVNAIMSFNETLATSGGGPRYGFTETATGLPVKQTLRSYTTYRATQSGSVTGYGTWPTPPLPIFGSANLEEAPRISRQSPEWKGTSYTSFTVTWEYKYASASPLSGLPNVTV